MIVYRHIRLDKNEPFYIGIGSSIDRAYRKDGRNPIWENIVASTEYDIEILFDNLSKEEACEKEKEFINLYGRIVNKTGTLANITTGGDILIGSENPMYNKGVGIIIDGFSYPCITEASRKLNQHEKTIIYRLKSKAFCNYTYLDDSKNAHKIPKEKLSEYKKLNNPMYGKHHAEKTKKLISQKNTGKKKSLLQSIVNKVVKLNRKEIIVDGDVYMSIGHAAHYLNVSSQVLAKALKKGYRCKGKSVAYSNTVLYTKDIILKYFEKYPDKVDIYPHPKMIEMLKSL